MKRKRRRDTRYTLGKDPVQRKQHATWYRGEHCNFTPSKTNMAEKRAIHDYILKGWLPASPPIRASDSILAVGSCFAQHIVAYLRRSRKKLTINEGSNINLFAFGAGFVNTFTLLQQFEWALGKTDIKSAVLYVEDPKCSLGQGLHRFKLLRTDESQRIQSRKAIMAADAFIFSLGLSEVWYEQETGAVFFGAIPSEKFDATKHGFRVMTVPENLTNLRRLHECLREIKPKAPIVFTLSPVPLTATFRPVSCITATSVSKAILRVAVDELVRDTWDPQLYYWPSYEIVQDYYGLDGYKDDRRHPKPEVVDNIMRMFERYYVQS